MWWAIQSYIKLVVLVVVVCAAAAYLPGYLQRIVIPDEYDDLKGLKGYSSVGIEPPPFAIGNVVAFKIGDMPDAISFGRVAALPGDTIEFKDGRLIVGGVTFEGFDPKKSPPLASPDLGPIVVPDGHVFVLSDNHKDDSLRRGLLGPDVLLGKLRL